MLSSSSPLRFIGIERYPGLDVPVAHCTQNVHSFSQSLPQAFRTAGLSAHINQATPSHKTLATMLFQTTLVSLALAASAVHAAAVPGFTVDQRDLVRRSLSGQATYYGGNVKGGACSFSTYTLPAGLYGTAISDSNWDTAGQCGGCVQATYQGKSVTAMVSLPAQKARSSHSTNLIPKRSSTNAPAAAPTTSTFSRTPSPPSPPPPKASSTSPGTTSPAPSPARYPST